MFLLDSRTAEVDLLFSYLVAKECPAAAAVLAESSVPRAVS